MKKVEILAPAGSMESLIAAVNSGADAVYLGGSKFSARAYASNFDNDNMIKAVDYAHVYGVKVYVTLNTILKEDELLEAIKYVGFLYDIGVDAIIIQDMGLCKKVREEYPDFELHASTQMTIHNAEGAVFFKENGFTRIVLSRELSLEEIKYISTDLGIETEIFVHGALCISYSGQCLMSSMIGGRSGNRGRCAQPCRMEYTLKGEYSGEKEAYLLSPKDLCTIEDVEEIVNTGAYSLKLEGRMKRPEYVAGVVKNYRDAVDSVLFRKKFNAKEGKHQLAQLFNRGGFTTAFLLKDNGRDMMSYDAPRNTGLPLGVANDKLEVLVKEHISLGDGVRADDKGFEVNKIILNGKEVKEANPGDVVKLYPIRYKKGQNLFKSGDKSLLDTLYQSTKPYLKKIDIECKVWFKAEENFVISLNHEGKEYTYKGEIVQKATNRPLTMERIEEALIKTGDTPFNITSIEFHNFDEGFMRISDINNLRRDALLSLQKEICRRYRRHRSGNKQNLEFKEKNSMEITVYQCAKKGQLEALIEFGLKDIAVDILTRGKEAIRVNDIISVAKVNKDINFYIKTPNIVKSEFNEVCELINKCKEHIKGLVTSNAGFISKFKDEMLIIGDYKLNIINSSSIDFYGSIIDLPILSLELNRKEIKQILKKTNQNVGMLIYGKPEVMVSEYCPIGSTFGNKTSTQKCSGSCNTENFKLVDRMKESYSVMTDVFCRSYIISPKAINLFNELEDIKELGVKSFKVEFRDESKEEVIKILSYLNKNKTFDSSNFTKGHYRKGIE